MCHHMISPFFSCVRQSSSLIKIHRDLHECPKRKVIHWNQRKKAFQGGWLALPEPPSFKTIHNTDKGLISGTWGVTGDKSGATTVQGRHLLSTPGLFIGLLFKYRLHAYDRTRIDFRPVDLFDAFASFHTVWDVDVRDGLQGEAARKKRGR
jgi:hypothetical protein